MEKSGCTMMKMRGLLTKWLQVYRTRSERLDASSAVRDMKENCKEDGRDMRDGKEMATKLEYKKASSEGG